MTKVLSFPSIASVPGQWVPPDVGGGAFLRDSLRAPASSGFAHSREVPAEWDEAIRAVSPITEEVGWLKLWWEPGDPWVPGQRFMLYEMIHEKWIDDDVWVELRGPHPRSEGHMCSEKVPHQFQCLCKRKFEDWRGGPCDLITLTQWQLYREVPGYFARPFWVLQGTTGGHKAEFSEQEKALCRYAELPEDPPRIGDLPFAPFDQRVLKQIMRHNRLLALGVTLEQYRGMMGSGYEKYREDLARQLRAEHVGFLTTQLADVNDAFIHAANKGEMDNEQRTSIEWEKVEEASTAAFIETGHLLDPSQVK